METYEILLDGNLRIGIYAYDYVFADKWVRFRDWNLNTIAVFNSDRVIAVTTRMEKEADDEETEGTVE